MGFPPKRHSRLLRSVLTFALLLSTTNANNNLFGNFNDPNECGSNQYLCGCQAVPATEMEEIRELLHQDLPCEQLCDQQTCDQSCSMSACSYPMGTLDELCTTTVLDHYKVNFVRSADCFFNEEMLVYECRKGDSVAYPDKHTHEAITEGYCIPSCELDPMVFKCTFEPRFREETDIKEEDRQNPPYTTIVGAVGQSVLTLPRPEDPETTEAVDPDEFGPVRIPSADGPGDESVQTKRDPTAGSDDPGYSPAPEPAMPSEIAQPPSEPSQESTSPAPTPVSQPLESQPAETPEEPVVKPIESQTPTEPPESDPPTIEEETPSPAPAVVETPAPAPETEKETPIPEPTIEVETPAPEPSTVEMSTPAPEPEEEPAVTEPAVEEKPPAPEPETETPAPAPEPEEEPLTEPTIEEQAPAPEPETVEEPAIAEPLAPAGPPSASIEGVDPTGDFTLYYSDFGDCTQVCSRAGDSYKERSITCRNHAGVPVELNLCKLPNDLQEQYFSQCQPEDCGSDYYIVLSDWSECPKTCATVMADGTVVPNRSQRDFSCRRVSDDSEVNSEECEDLISDLGVALTRDCNSSPCSRYVYSASQWSDCNCRTWSRQRTAICTDEATGQEVATSFCQAFGLNPPSTQQPCFSQACFENAPTRKLLQTRDYCDFTQCSTKGECANQECECREGFTGMDCQIDSRSDSQCPLPSLLNAEGGCCESGIFDLKGSCCDASNSESEIDIDGECCTGRSLDGCGNCSGEVPHFIDASAQCCKALDALGMCCSSGNVDECGVCDGFSRSCNTTISFNVRIEDGDLDQCLRELRDTVQDALDISNEALTTHSQTESQIGFSKTDVMLTSGFIWFRLQEALENRQLNQLCNIDGHTTSKFPVCGNGFCEIDETENCPEDCDFGIELCEMQRGLYGEPVMCNGHGLCSFKEKAECNCFTGYEGEKCELCSEGFFQVENDNRCIPGEAFTNRPRAARPFVPVVQVEPTTGTTVSTLSSRAADTPSASRTSNAEVIYWPIIAAGCLLGLLLVTLVAFVALRRRKDAQKPVARFHQEAFHESPLHEEDPALVSGYDRLLSEAGQDTAPAVISSR